MVTEAPQDGRQLAAPRSPAGSSIPASQMTFDFPYHRQWECILFIILESLSLYNIYIIHFDCKVSELYRLK